MLNRLVEMSLRYKFLVLIIFAVVAFLGVNAVRNVPIDAFPDVTPVQVNIYTESPGLAAEDIELLLTTPVESALAGLPKVREIRSVSLFGLSYVAVYFEDDMDIYFARQLVNERLQEIGDRLPDGYGKPSMGPNTSGLGQVFWYTVERAPGVGKDKVTDMDLRTWQEWTVRLILRTAPGVDDVTSWGGGEREYQVQIDPQRLYARGLGFGDVINALPSNNGQVGGNVMDVGREQFLVRGLGLLKSTEDIGEIVLKAEDGVPVYLRDVATVVEAPAPRFGAVTRDGEEVVLGMALARIGENAKDVVEAVKGKLDVVRDALPEGIVLRPIYERTDLVNKAVGTASLALFPFLGKEFMPQLQEGSIMWRVTGIPSTSLNESIKTSNTIAKAFEQFPEVDTTLAMIGRAEKGETADVNYMEIYTALKPEDEWKSGRNIKQLEEAMQETLEKVVPNVVPGYTQPIQMRVEELISGVRATLALKLYGQDLQELDRISGQLKTALGNVQGVADLSLEANVGKPQIRIEVDRDELARHGMNAEEVLTIVRNGLGGEPVSVLLDGVKRFDIAVRLIDATRNSVESLRQIPLRTATGAVVPLSEVADVTVGEGYSFVRREQLQRYAVIQMDVRGRDVDGFVKEADAAIKQQVKLPAGYWIEWGGAFENQQRALAKLALIVPITIFFIFVLLYTAFNSIKYASLILVNVPFATIGGLLALFVTGQYLSVPSAIGFIAVFGVAMLNGIVLVSFLNELREKGLSVREAVVQGTALRLRPVLMTASVAILGLVPMLLSSGVGAETQRPLATVVVGGLISSTLLTLILLPVLYEWLENRADRKAVERNSRENAS